MLIVFAFMLIDNLYFFQLTRFLIGLRCGIVTVLTSVIISEILPRDLACKFNVSIYTFCAFGFIVSSGVGVLYHTSDPMHMDPLTNYWQLALVWPVSISFLRLWIHLVYYNFDTSHFYFSKYGNCEYSRKKSLDTFRNIYIESHVQQATQNVSDQINLNSKSEEICVNKLFSWKYRNQMIAAILFQFFSIFTGNGFFMLYSVTVFEKLGQNANIITLILNITT